MKIGRFLTKLHRKHTFQDRRRHKTQGKNLPQNGQKKNRKKNHNF